ncbi:MAG: hypothetical protein CME32_17420 [Gimesia sp.]|nr:hypothetical protein [Gimesia sp.]
MSRISQYNNPGGTIKGSGGQSRGENAGILRKWTCNEFKLPSPYNLHFCKLRPVFDRRNSVSPWNTEVWLFPTP